MSTEEKKKNIPEAATALGGTPSESVVVRTMSSDDSAVADLVKEQPTLAQIEAMEIVNHQSVPDPLELPEECKPLHRVKYCFGWLNKGKDLAARTRSGGWIVCNQTNAPFIKRSRFGSHGAVEQGGMILAFMPEAQYRVFEEAPAKRSADLVKHYTKDLAKGDPDAPISFYQPEIKDEKD